MDSVIRSRHDLLFLLDEGYLRQWRTGSGKHIILTRNGWEKGYVKNAYAIYVGEDFDFKRDEERLLHRLMYASRPPTPEPPEVFKIERAPPVEAKSTGSVLWIVWHMGSKEIEEHHEKPEDATKKRTDRVVLFFLDGKSYLRQYKTSWCMHRDKYHLILTENGWRYRRDIEEADAINVGEDFDFKRDEEKLRQTLISVSKVDGEGCFQDAMYML